MTSRDRRSARRTTDLTETLEVGWSRLPQLLALLDEVARTPGARVSVIQLDPDTTERVIARRDADVPVRALYRWALLLFRDHAPPGPARFRVRTWTQQGRPIRGVVCGRGYDPPAHAPAPPVMAPPATPTPASDAERRRALARAEAAEARVAALEAQLRTARPAPAPPADPGAAAPDRRLAEQETQIKALERERAKFKDLADQEKARADDWKDQALALAVRVGRFAQEAGEE